MPETKKSAKGTTATKKKWTGFSAEESAAARERVKELRAESGDGEATLLAKIAEMTEADRLIAKRVHAVIKASAPSLTSTTWYGMPAYAKDGKIVCHFQPAQKFKTRYATLGFSDKAHLDEGNMWPNAYALMPKLTAVDEKRITDLVKKAVS